MKQQKILYFNHEDPMSEMVHCVRLKDGIATDLGQVRWDSIKDMADEEEDLILVIPGEQVMSLILKLPKGSSRHLQQVVPNLLEEQLAAPIETLHFATGKATSEGDLICAVIDRCQLEDYLKKLELADVHSDAVIPDYWSIESLASDNTVHQNGRLLTRCPDHTGWTVLDRIDDKTSQLLYGKPANVLLADLPSRSLPQTLNPPVNLLQGNYAVNRASTNRVTYRTLGVCALISSAILLSYFLIAGWYFNQQTLSLQQQATALYQSLFPGDKRIVNIRQQMEVHLRQQQNVGESRFFSLLQQLSVCLAKQQETTIRNLRFDHADNALQVEVTTTSIGNTNALQESLISMGVTAQILSANSSDGSVIARLRIGMKP